MLSGSDDPIVIGATQSVDVDTFAHFDVPKFALSDTNCHTITPPSAAK
jgi:hypothetical protein